MQFQIRVLDLTHLNEQISGLRVLVTGASGFIGRHLVDSLVAAGAAVTVWSRSRRTSAAQKSKSVNVIVGNWNDAAALDSAVKDKDAVFHLAYDGRATASANLSAFDCLLSASKRAKVGRFVHTSSIVVYDGWPDTDIDEQSTMNRPGGGPYRQAKIEMERRLMAGSLPTAILQPTIVYGVGSALWTEQFAEQLLDGQVVLPEPEGVCHGVFVDDVVQALLRAAVVPELAQERFIISGPSTFKWSALLEGYAMVLGAGTVVHEPVEQLQQRLGPVHEDTGDSDSLSPVLRAYAIGHKLLGRERFERLVRFVKRRVARGGKAYPDHHLLGVFYSSGNCSIARARDRLGYEPDYDLPKGLLAMESYLNQLAAAD